MMFNKKRILLVSIVLFALLVPVFAASENATITFTSFVGENVQNTGIRLTQDAAAIPRPGFDAKYLAAASVMTLDNTAKDNSLFDVSGTFSVLVRRQTVGKMKVALTISPLKNGTSFLNYSLTASRSLDGMSGSTVQVTTAPRQTFYHTEFGQTGDPSGRIVRDQTIFNYLIPADINATKGTYSADILFEMTVV